MITRTPSSKNASVSIRIILRYVLLLELFYGAFVHIKSVLRILFLVRPAAFSNTNLPVLI